MTDAREPRAWPTLLAALAVYHAGLAALAWSAGSYREAWHRVGLYALSPSFFDLHNLMSAYECARRGLDVLVNNPCDRIGRALTYPSAWLALGPLGLDQRWTVGLGLGFAVAFYAAALWTLRTLPRAHAPVAAALLLSMPVGLLVERGNNDALIFAALAVAVWLIARPGRPARAAGYALVLTAAVLKLYPLAATVTVLREPARRARFWVGTAIVGGFTAYWAAHRGELATLLASIPAPEGPAYGADLLPSFAARTQGLTLARPEARLAAAVLLALAAAVAWGWARRLAPRWPADPEPPGEATLAFLVGALVFLGTFATGRHWDYRLAFLLLCLPALSAWLRAGDAAGRYARITLVALVAVMWVEIPFERGLRFRGYAFSELPNWAAWTALSAGVLLALPGSARRTLRIETGPG